MREKPKSYLERACQLFRSIDGKNIVEIGMIRREDYAHREGDGWSTSYWLDIAEKVWTTDIDNNACELVRRLFSRYTNLFVFNEDGIEFISKFKHPIDLLYLDAMAGDEDEAPEFHLKIYQIARDNGLLTDRAMILIDDTDLHNGGKGKLVIPEAIRDGLTQVFTGRQTLLMR